MSIVQQQKDLESFSDDMLHQEGMRPSGRYPQFLIVTEVQRRKDMRDRSKAQQYQGTSTVTDKLMREMNRGIPSVDPHAGEPVNMPGMRSGVAKFASGGMIPGYQTGGQPPLTEAERRKLDYMMKQVEWMSATPTNRSANASQIQALQNSINSMMSGADKRTSYYGPRKPFGVGIDNPVQPMSYGPPPAEGEQAMPWDESPHAPYENLLDISDRLKGMTAAQDQYNKFDPKAAFAPAQRRLDAMAGAQDEYASQARRDMANVQNASNDYRDVLGRLAEYQRSTVREDPSEIEAQLSGMRRTPEQVKSEKMSLALSGLGSLIGGARNLGDVASGMGGVTNSILARSQEMRDEDRDLITQVGALAEQRRNQNINAMTQAFMSEGQSADVARASALQAYEMNSNLHSQAMSLAQTAASIESNIGQAINSGNLARLAGSSQIASHVADLSINSDRMRLELEEAFRAEVVGRAVNPNVLTQVIGSLGRTVTEYANGLLPGADEEYIKNIQENQLFFTRKLREILNKQYNSRLGLSDDDVVEPGTDGDGGVTLVNGGR